MVLRLLQEESKGVLLKFSSEPKITADMWSKAYIFAVSALIKTKKDDDEKFSFFSLRDPSIGELTLEIILRVQLFLRNYS